MHARERVPRSSRSMEIPWASSSLGPSRANSTADSASSMGSRSSSSRGRGFRSGTSSVGEGGRGSTTRASSRGGFSSIRVTTPCSRRRGRPERRWFTQREREMRGRHRRLPSPSACPQRVAPGAEAYEGDERERWEPHIARQPSAPFPRHYHARCAEPSRDVASCRGSLIPKVAPLLAEVRGMAALLRCFAVHSTRSHLRNSAPWLRAFNP